MCYVFKGAQSYLFNFFQTFRHFTITKSSYFSHNPWKILQLKSVEDIDENVSGYGNHN